MKISHFAHAILIGSLFLNVNVAISDPHVLILNSYQVDHIWSDHELQGEIEVLKDAFPQIELNVEYLDYKRFPDVVILEQMRGLLIAKYTSKPIDLIITNDNAALDFILVHREEIFNPVPPVVFAGYNGFEEISSHLPPDVTGVPESLPIAESFNTILRLHPQLKRIHVLIEQTLSGNETRAEIEKIARQYHESVDIRFFENLPMAQLLERVEQLEPGEVIYIAYYTRDGSGEYYSHEHSAEMITDHSHVPVYHSYEFTLGSGVLGGHMISPHEHGAKAAEIAVRLLHGEPVNTLEPDYHAGQIPIFDYLVMRRFGIHEQALPPGAQIVNYPNSVLREYGHYFLLALLFIVGQTILIIWLLVLQNRRREAEKALRESEERFRTAFETSPDAYTINGLDDAVYSQVNQGFYEFTGYEAHEVVGRSSMDLNIWYDPRDRKRFLLKLMRSGRVENMEIPFRMKDGSLRYGLISARVVTINEKQHVLALTRDLHEYRMTENARQRLEAQFRHLFETSKDAIYIRRGTRFLHVSPSFEKLFGFTRKEVLDEHFKMSDLIVPNDHNRILSHGRSFENGDTNQALVSFTGIRRDGETVELEVNLSHIEWEDEPAVMGLVRDITRQKQLEEQLRHAQKMEAIGRLAGGIAHDFNNLLTVISGNAEIASVLVRNDAVLQKTIDEINDTTERAAALTRHLLAFSRKQMIHPRTLDLNLLITDMKDMINRIIGERISLIVNQASDPLLIHADPSQIEQVILNLVVNARDAMNESGILTIETSRPTLPKSDLVDSGNFPTDDSVLLCVSDTGSGIAAENLPRIFEPFFSTKDKGKGTGLGLSTVYGIIKQNHGDIQVQSVPGKGSVFTVFLPRSQGELTSDDVSDHKEQVNLTGDETVLVVEDEEAVRTMISKSLTELGYSVLEAENGDEAVQILERDPDQIDLILTDVVMPGLSAGELINRILSISPNLKMLHMSGHAEDTIVEEGVIKEGIHFIAKPFQARQLAAMIRKLLDSDESSPSLTITLPSSQQNQG